jgi:hypothetical protein
MPKIGPRPELVYAYAEACERGFEDAAVEILTATEQNRVAAPGVIHRRDAMLWIAVSAVDQLAAELGVTPAELITVYGMGYTAQTRARLVLDDTEEIP